jgi:hypothetical protein
MNHWTKKHTKFSVQNRLTPTARELWQWLLDEMKEGSNDIIDLRDFNKWVKRTRGFPHDRKTVKSAAQQLRDKGVLTNATRYTPYVWKWRLEPIRVLIPPPFRPPQKKSNNQPEIPNLDPSKPQSEKDECITTTTGNLNEKTAGVNEKSHDEDLEQKLEACRVAGIYYHPKDAVFMRNFSFENVLKAIKYYLCNCDAVCKPEGWFRRCLEDNWAEQEEQRQPLRAHWSIGGLIEAARYFERMKASLSATD